MIRLAILILLLFFNSSCFAVDIPQSSTLDNRIQYVNYHSDDVVVVRTVVGVGLRIVFSDNEVIEDNIGSGFSGGWELTKSKNILFVKAKSIKTKDKKQPTIQPKPGVWDTNLMVTTNLRLYDLDLKLLPKTKGRLPKNKRIAYRVQYLYPDEEVTRAKKLISRRNAEAQLSNKSSPQNWDYSMQIGDDSEGIAPTMAYDDGRFTYLKFPNNRDFPSAFLVAVDKTESIVNSHINPSIPDVLVIHRVSREIVLRLGNSVVGIYNDNYDPDGIPARDGSTVPGVQRILVGE